MVIAVYILCAIGIFFSGSIVGMLLVAWRIGRRVRKLYCVVMTGLSVRGPSLIPVVARDPDEVTSLVRSKYPFGKIEAIRVVIGTQFNVAIQDHWGKHI
jgi:hypothetical protein